MSSKESKEPKEQKEHISLSSFTNLTQIGRGAFGVVFRAIYEKNSKAFAIKKISKKKIKEQKMEQQVMKEIKISYQLKHPHIIHLYDVVNEGDNVCLILELAQHGQLYTRLIQKRRLDDQFAKKVIAQTLSALKYLHTMPQPIIHRDIKPENILLDSHDDVKLADFGWSNYSNQKRTTYCGTHEYLAPEMIDDKNDKGHDHRLDIWCLGILAFEILAGQPPFSMDSNNPNVNQAKAKMYDNIMNVRVSFPKDFPPMAKDFVMRVLKKDPQQRASLEELEEHPWLKSQPVSRIPQKDMSSPRRDLPKEDGEIKLKGIIDDLNRKNQELQKEVNSLKVKEGVKRQELVVERSGEDSGRVKALEEINDKYKKQMDNLRSQLLTKDKDMLKLKVENKSASEARQDCDQYKTENNSLQEKYRNLRRMHEELEQKYLDLTTTLENERLDSNTKLKEARRNGGGAQSESLGILGDLQQAMSQLSKKFSESKKLIAEVSRRQSNVQNLQKQLQKLRFHQSTVKEEVQAEMREIYEGKMDEVMLKARDDIQKQKDKWLKEREELMKMVESEPSTEYSGNALNSNRDLEIDQELKKTRELNQFLERRIKEQEFRILDLEEATKRKK